MKSLVKPLIKKFLFENHEPKKFVAVRLSTGEIRENVILKSRKTYLDISQRHCVACHDPFLLAVCIASNQYPVYQSGAKVQIRRGQNVDAEITVSHKLGIEAGPDVIVVFEVKNVQCYQLSWLHQYILLKRYFLHKKKDTYLQGKIYCAMYAYPRAVIVVSFKNKEGRDIFPIDFQCFINASNTYLFAIQTSNTALKEILRDKRVVISDTTYADIQSIYTLGRHHSAKGRPGDEVPFGFSSSELFDFPVPDFSASYMEVEIIKHIELGTHTFIIGHVINLRQLKPENHPVCHIHFFKFIRSSYGELLP